MFTVTRDSDPRKPLLAVTSDDTRFVTIDDGKTIVLHLNDARQLVEALMTETMRINLFAEEEEHED